MVAGSWLDLRRYSICRVAKSHLMAGDMLVEFCWHNAYIHWLFEMSCVFLNVCTHCLTNTRKLCVRPLCSEMPIVTWRAPPCVQQLWQEGICRQTAGLSEASRAGRTCRLFLKWTSQTVFDPISTWLVSRSEARVCGRSLLGLRVRIPSGAWMFVCCDCCVLSCRGLCDGSIPRPGDSYWLCECVCVCVTESDKVQH